MWPTGQLNAFEYEEDMLSAFSTPAGTFIADTTIDIFAWSGKKSIHLTDKYQCDEHEKIGWGMILENISRGNYLV